LQRHCREWWRKIKLKTVTIRRAEPRGWGTSKERFHFNLPANPSG
jgi:hypothetical protein